MAGMGPETAPAALREQLRHLSTTTLLATCARLRPTEELTDPEQATKAALRRLARRHQYLSEEIADADAELTTLVTVAAVQASRSDRACPDDVGGRLHADRGARADR